MSAAVAALPLVLLAVIRRDRPLVTPDEAWMLQVARRCRSGDRLYADVWYGAGPLPLWAIVPFAGSVEAAGRRARALQVVPFAVGVLAVAAVLELPLAVALAAAATGLSGPAHWPNTYGEWARGGAAVSVAALVAWDGGTGLVLPAIAGVAAAVSLLSLQTVGVVVAGGVGAGVALLATAVGPTVAFGVAVAVPVASAAAQLARRGALRAAWRHGVTGKRTYASLARIRPGTGLRRSVAAARRRGDLPSVAVALASYGIVLGSSVVAVGGLLLAVVEPAGRAQGLGAAVLAAAALAGAAFRADLPHVQSSAWTATAAAVLLVSGVAAADGPDLAVPVAALLVAGSLPGLRMLASRPTGVAAPAPLRGLQLPVDLAASLASTDDALRSTTGGDVFVLRPDASLWYLVHGLRNPTPYDYPYVTTFGSDGQQLVAAAIERGEVPWVVAPEGGTRGPLAPVELESCVERLPIVADVGPGLLRRSTPRPAAGSAP